MDTLSRMIEVARGHQNVLHVLSSCGEFTAAEIVEYLPQVVAEDREPLRMGAVH
jgi:hypothetical protein